MSDSLLRPTAPTFAITTLTHTAFATEMLKKKYTKEEIFASVQTAEKWADTVDYTDPVEIEKAWNVVHKLTSDSAWGVGMGSVVDPYLKLVTRKYVRGLIEHTSQYLDIFSVANFMTRHFRRMKDPGFTRLLRAHLLAFPETFETVSTLTRQQNLYFLDTHDDVCYHPMVMAAISFKVPASVMHTLLQAGVSVDTRNILGETALMLTAQCVGTVHDEKMDLLLNYGASIDAFDEEFNNVFHSACKYCNTNTVSKLLNARKQRIKDCKDEGEDTWDDKTEPASTQFSGTAYGTSEPETESECECEDGGMMDDAQTDDAQTDDQAMHAAYTYTEEETLQQVRKEAAGAYEKRLTEQMVFQDTFGYKNEEYATRLRNKHLLYVDPIQTRTVEDESLLMYASKRCLLWNARDFKGHMQLLRMLACDGAPSEGIWKYSKTPAYAGLYPDRTGNFLNYGLARFVDIVGGDDGDGFLTFAIQKDGYNVTINMGLDEIFPFIVLGASTFPFHEIPSREDIVQIFRDMKFGAMFDFLSSADDFANGDDFDLNFFVEDFEQENGHHAYKKTSMRLSDAKVYHENFGTVRVRFPKGPLSQHLFHPENNPFDDDSDDEYLAREVVVNKGLTFLQEAVVQKNRDTRCFSSKGARELCNPLSAGECGRTALVMLEETLKKNTEWALPGVYSVSGLHRNDRGFLQKIRKDHDEMITHVFRGALVGDAKSVLYNEDEKKVATRSNKRKAITKARFSSPFHRLPDELCAKIISFL